MDDAARRVASHASVSSIAGQVETCLSTFEILLSTLLQSGAKHSREITVSEVGEEAGRFRVWAGNIGAHRTGRSSLDYRLRDASHIRTKVISLLGDIIDFTTDAIRIIKGEKTPWDKSTQDFDSDSSESSNSGNRLDDVTELRQLSTSIKKRISLLLRLSMSMRDPAAHDQFLMADIDTSHYEVYDIKHVQDKFPSASELIALRLGKAISKRRLYLKFREAHVSKLAQGLTAQHSTSGNDNATQFHPQSTVASSLPERLKGEEVVDVDDTPSQSSMTQTSLASSTGGDGESLRVPPLPKEADSGEPFECPFCLMIVSIHDQKSWKRHVFQDLRPYVCTFDEWAAAHRLFRRRHEWFQHEKQFHRRRWQCTVDCERSFPRRSDLEDHLLQAHPQVSFTENSSSLFLECEMNANLESLDDCCFCEAKNLTLHQLERHLGRHQEQLALFALPQASEDVDTVDKSESSASEESDQVDSPPTSPISEGKSDQTEDTKTEAKSQESLPQQVVKHPLPLTLEECFHGTQKTVRIRREIFRPLTGKTDMETKDLKIYIRKGLMPKSKIKYSSIGNQGPDGIAQDILFIIEDEWHPLFKRSGSDLRTTVEITMGEAIGGWRKDIRTICGRRLKVKGPKSTPDGWTCVLPGFGMPKSRDPNVRGDLIVEVEIQVSRPEIKPDDSSNINLTESSKPKHEPERLSRIGSLSIDGRDAGGPSDRPGSAVQLRTNDPAYQAPVDEDFTESEDERLLKQEKLALREEIQELKAKAKTLYEKNKDLEAELLLSRK